MNDIRFMRRIAFALSLLFLAFTANLQAQIQLEVEKGDNSVSIWAENPMPVPLTVWLDLDLRNMEPEGDMPESFLVPANSRKMLLRLLPVGSGGHGYTYEYSTALGDVMNAHHDDSVAYLLPYPPGEEYMMSQGPDGKISHKGLSAYDFTMDMKSLVTAARGGIVVLVKANSNSGCDSPDCMELANRIMVLHEDGSLGTYTHLSKNGALVKVGQQVEAGDRIGLSGNTGWSSGPHLHFEVTLPTAEGEIGVGDVLFRTDKGVEHLHEGQWYQAP